MKFTNKQHESNFLDLMVMDNTYHDDKAEAERRQSGLLLATIVDTLAEVLRWQEQQQNMQFDCPYHSYEDENEFEL